MKYVQKVREDFLEHPRVGCDKDTGRVPNDFHELNKRRAHELQHTTRIPRAKLRAFSQLLRNLGPDLAETGQAFRIVETSDYGGLRLFHERFASWSLEDLHQPGWRDVSNGFGRDCSCRAACSNKFKSLLYFCHYQGRS